MVAVDSWSAEWSDEENSEPTAWLFDAGCNPVVLPAEAAGFRVRCLPPGSRGLGEVVLDDQTGLGLFVPRSTGPKEFAELVGYRAGRYKLAAVDASYQYLRDVPIATFTVTAAMVAAHQAATGRAPAGSGAPSPATSDPLLLELVREQLRAAKTPSHADPLVLELVSVLRTALTESRVALSESLGVIRAVTADGTRNVSELVRASATVVTAADGAGIARREPLPVVVPPLPPPVVPAALPAPAEDVGAGGAANFGDIVTGAISSLAPLLQHVVNTKVFKMSEEMSLATIRAMTGVANANMAPAAAQPVSVETPAAAQPASVETTPATSTTPAGPQPASVETTPATTAPTTSAAVEAAPSIHPSALWPHIASIERHLSEDEAAVVRRYLVCAPADQIAQLAREVMSRSAADAAAWIRSLLAHAAEPSETPASTAPTKNDPYS